MNQYKRLILFCLLSLMWIMVGCSAPQSAQNSGDITIVCTSFPLYDWTRQILGESDAEVILLLDNGTDMHSAQPSAEDLIQIADCDVLVHVGGESDAWLMDALEANPNEERMVVNLMEALKEELREEQYIDGMHIEHEHEHEQEDENVAMDEHIWLSLRLAVKSCDAIENALCQALPNEAEQIRANADVYCGKLEDLDRKYADMVTNSVDECAIIVADRFPFMYMMEDYGIKYYAAFPGCSTESEADFETVVFLAEKVKEGSSKSILITESGTEVLANTVMENAGMESGEILVLHSMQVVYQSDIENGCSYLGYMEQNLTVLERVLGE